MKTGGVRAESRVFWCASALAAGALFFGLRGHSAALGQSLLFFADRGELLFHAVRDKAAAYNMPFLGLLGAAQAHLGFDPALPARLAALLICLAAFGIGARGGGRAKGAVYALAAALAGFGGAPPETEQLVFTFSMLLFLSLELNRQAGAGGCAPAGLAAGITMLIRSPLFAFPPLAVVYQYFSPRLSTRKLAACSALFLVCAYLPLAPWARLNYSLFGRVILLEEERSVSNIVTGAMGMVNTMEGDARSYAGLSRTESVYPWAVRTIAGKPGAYAAAVLKRIAAVFLMSPVLFLLAAAALLLVRSAESRFLAFFAAYFILVHCLMAVEERYFYPLRHVLALLAAGGVWELAARGGVPAAAPGRDIFSRPLFLALAALSAMVMWVVCRYPGAARPPLAAAAAGLEKYPEDRWLAVKKGRILLSYDMTERGLEAFGRAPGEAGLRYIREVLASASPPPAPELPEKYELTLVKLLRELETGSPSAGRTYAAAYGHWRSERNGIKGRPSPEESARLQSMISSNKTFLDMDIPSALLYWPPGKRSGIIRRLAGLTPLTPGLRALELRWKAELSGEEKRELAALSAGAPWEGAGWRNALESLIPELLGRVSAPPRAADGDLGALLSLRLSPAVFAASFDPHAPRDDAAALKAAVKLYLASDRAERLAAARELAAVDGSDFSYVLLLLDAESFSPAVVAAVQRGLRSRPYPLAAGARVFAAAGDPASAAKLARSAATAGRLSEAGWLSTLMSFQAAGEIKSGLSAADKALREQPSSAALLNARGVLRRLNGDMTGAAEDFGKALENAPGDFSALMNMGSLLEREGKTRPAAVFYRRAMATGPAGKRSAAEALERLDGTE